MIYESMNLLQEQKDDSILSKVDFHYFFRSNVSTNLTVKSKTALVFQFPKHVSILSTCSLCKKSKRDQDKDSFVPTSCTSINEDI